MNMFFSRNDIIQFGTRSDVCEITARELAVKEQIHIVEARNRLRGQYTGKKMLKIRFNGNDVCISLEKIHELAKKYPLDEPAEEPKEEAKKEEKAKEKDSNKKDDKKKEEADEKKRSK